MSSLADELCLLFVTFIDIWFLWTTLRFTLVKHSAAEYRQAGKITVACLKWACHVLSYQSELSRFLVYIVGQAPGEEVDADHVIFLNKLLATSLTLRPQWNQLCSGGLATEEKSAVADEICAAKGVPSGPLKHLFSIGIDRITVKYSLISKCEAMRSSPVTKECTADVQLLQATLIHLMSAPQSSPQKIPSEKWKELGFQGVDPCTDFRGTGHLGLFQLHRAALRLNSEGKKATAMPSDFDIPTIYREAQNGPYWYSFAIVAINVTQALHSLLRTDQLDRTIFASGNQTVAELLTGVLQEHYNRILWQFHTRWMDARPDNLMAFNSIFADTLIAYRDQLP